MILANSSLLITIWLPSRVLAIWWKVFRMMKIRVWKV